MHFTMEAQNRIRSHFEPFGRKPRLAIDATAGNGFDTLFLAELVGNEGRVVAIDIQDLAIQTAKKRLGSLGNRVTWCCQCHSQLHAILEEQKASQLDVAMFNLGYLPFGDKQIITSTNTTLLAISTAAENLEPHGIMSILSYPGHPGGSDEHLSVVSWISQRSAQFHIQQFCDETNQRSPTLWLLTKKLPS
jgi:predicted methyltransferase